MNNSSSSSSSNEVLQHHQHDYSFPGDGVCREELLHLLNHVCIGGAGAICNLAAIVFLLKRISAAQAIGGLILADLASSFLCSLTNLGAATFIFSQGRSTGICVLFYLALFSPIFLGLCFNVQIVLIRCLNTRRNIIQSARVRDRQRRFALAFSALSIAYLFLYSGAQMYQGNVPHPLLNVCLRIPNLGPHRGARIFLGIPTLSLLSAFFLLHVQLVLNIRSNRNIAQLHDRKKDLKIPVRATILSFAFFLIWSIAPLMGLLKVERAIMGELIILFGLMTGAFRAPLTLLVAFKLSSDQTARERLARRKSRELRQAEVRNHAKRERERLRVELEMKSSGGRRVGDAAAIEGEKEIQRGSPIGENDEDRQMCRSSISSGRTGVSVSLSRY